MLNINRQTIKTKPPRRQDRQGSEQLPILKVQKRLLAVLISYSLGGLGVLAVLISLLRYPIRFPPGLRTKSGAQLYPDDLYPASRQ